MQNLHCRILRQGLFQALLLKSAKSHAFQSNILFPLPFLAITDSVLQYLAEFNVDLKALILQAQVKLKLLFLI